MKITLFSSLTLMLMVFAFVPNSSAQDYTRWHLPEDAIARIGKGNINEITYSPDGTRLAVAGSTGIWIYDAHTGTELDWLTRNTSDPDRASSITYSPDGRTLASAGTHKAYLWEAGTGQLKDTLTVPAIGNVISSVNSIRYSPDGRILACGGYADDAVRLWDTATGNQLKTLQGHTKDITSVAFSPDGTTLASGSYDNTVQLWDVESGAHKVTLTHTRPVTSVRFSPDGTTLATACWDGKIRLWNPVTGRLKSILTEHWWSRSVSFSPDGTTFAGGNWDGKIRLWDVRTGKLKSTLEGHTTTVISIAFRPDSRTLATARDDGTIQFWDVRTGRLKSKIEGHTNAVNQLVYSPDGGTLAIGYYEAVRLCDARTGQLKSTLPTRANSGDSLAYAPDGATLAIASGKTVHLWDTVAGHQKASFTGDTKWVGSVAFSPNGSTLATGGGDGAVQLWDARSRTRRTTLIGHTVVNSIDFSPDGTKLATASYADDVRLWDANTGRLLKTFIGHPGGVVDVAFSPDSRTLAVESPGERYFDATVVLWDIMSGQRKATLQIARSCYYSGVRFSPDGTLLASGGNGGVLILWDVATGERLKAFRGHGHWIESIAFSPNGATLATGSADGTVLLWDVTPFIPAHGQQNTEVQQTQPTSDSEQTEPDTGIQQYQREMVRLIYFRPSDRLPKQSINTDLDTLIRYSQYFYAEQMRAHGRKTFAFETDPNGYARVHHVTGKFTDAYYHHDTYNKVLTEVVDQFDTSKNVYLIAIDVSSEYINQEGTCGIGGGRWKAFGDEAWRRDFGGVAVIPASGVCINPTIAAHELGHVFGLEHDFRDDTYLMAYGTQQRLSNCATKWLDAHRLFNNDPTFFNETATINMRAAHTSGPGTLRLHFELADADGLHQAQLLISATATDPAQGRKLHSCKLLNGKSQTIEFVTTNLTGASGSEVTLQVIDISGNITKQTFPITEDTISNRPPATVGTILAQTLTDGGSSTTLDMASYFNDPDDDILSYEAESNNTSIATVSVSASQLTITPRATGSAAVAVTASDSKLLRVVQHFSVYVKAAEEVDQEEQTDPDDEEGSLVLYFSFDELNGNQTIDHSQYQNHGTLAGTPLLVDGKFGKALKFNGESDWVEVPHHDSLTVDKAVTIMAWIHTPRHRGPRGASWQGIIAKSNRPRSYSLYTEASGKLHLSVAGFVGTASSETVALNEWQHVVAQMEDGWHRYWINGKNVGNFRVNASLPGSADKASVRIGNTHEPSRQFLGLIDEVRIYNRALTEAEIIEQMNSALEPAVQVAPALYLSTVEAPTETTLLPNYPNPFNPETWIPYQLATPADVTVRIYSVNGSLVRRVALGYQTAGLYRGRSNAAYWDGKNEVGEPVVSGIYFYTLTAGNFTATRKMLIQK